MAELMGIWQKLVERVQISKCDSNALTRDASSIRVANT